METLGNKKEPKNSFKYYCKNCDYGTCKKSNYANHITTLKHLKSINGNVLETYGNENQPKTSSSKYSCGKCIKNFTNRSGLWKHKSKGKCINNSENISLYETKEPTDKDLIMLLIKENSELKNIMMEQSNMVMKVLENGTTNTNSHNTTHTNSHNKAFNLNFFLNETCKDAMNIMDFVDSIKLQLSDLERVGELGYVEGISNIIVKNLKELDVTQRPVHCTDKKRETIYVKDEDKWEKDEEKTKMHKLVKKVADKNARMLPEFKKEYPDYNKASSKVSDQFNKIIIESMGGPGDNDYEKEEKIIKKVSKEVAVEKESPSL